jgi:hypothetical protein
MTEEKQESQKTVVAFIAGLLIGGLLVWVFSSTPEDRNVAENDNGTTTEDAGNNSNVSGSDVNQPATSTEDDEDGGDIEVADQPAGNRVLLGTTKFPKSGWIVVRDYRDGMPGRILGAARFNIEEGLLPKEIPLVRNTTSGSTYQVLFYTNEGGNGFSTAEDKPMDDFSTTFKAN